MEIGVVISTQRYPRETWVPLPLRCPAERVARSYNGTLVGGDFQCLTHGTAPTSSTPWCHCNRGAVRPDRSVYACPLWDRHTEMNAWRDGRIRRWLIFTIPVPERREAAERGNR